MPIPQMTAFFPQPVCKHSSFWSSLRDADSLFACHHHMQRLTDSTTISGRLTNSVLPPDAPFTTQLARTHLGYRDFTHYYFFVSNKPQFTTFNLPAVHASREPSARLRVHPPTICHGEWVVSGADLPTRVFRNAWPVLFSRAWAAVVASHLPITASEANEARPAADGGAASEHGKQRTKKLAGRTAAKLKVTNDGISFWPTLSHKPKTPPFLLSSTPFLFTPH